MIEVELPRHLKHPTMSRYLLDATLALEVRKIGNRYYMHRDEAELLPHIINDKNTAMMKAKAIDKQRYSFRLSFTV
jgi:uncharacterized protein (UPF0216 family)